MSGQQKKTVLETAAGMLGSRAYTKLELRRKLYKKEKFEPVEIERAVSELERMGFLSDLHYCEDAVRILQGRGYGTLRIRAKLLLKGVPRDILDQVLHDTVTEAFEEESDRAFALLEKNMSRFNRESDPRKKRMKMMRFLAGRGFSSFDVCKALEKSGQKGSELDENIL